MRRTPAFVIFLIIISAILYAGNLAIYEALKDLFGIAGFLPLFSLGMFLGVASASFIAASILSRYSLGAFARAYYLASGLWIGVLGHLFLFAVAYGIVSGLALFIPGIPVLIIGYMLFAAAVAVSIYGMFHARSILIREIEIVLPNLPEAWKGRTLAALSDLHLGPIYSSDFVEEIAEALKALSPDAVAIVGDLFDGVSMPDMHALLSPLRELSAPLGKYFVTGNHEGYGDEKEFLQAVRSAGIRILEGEIADLRGLQLAGVSYQSAAAREDFRRILAELGIDRGKPSILLKHEPRDIDVAAEAGISLQISGHTHAGQFWPFGLVANMTYKGFGYGLNRFQEKMQAYTSSGAGTWGPPLRVGTDSEIVLMRFISGNP